MTKQYTGKKKFKVHNGTFESIEIYAVFEIDFDYPNVKEKIIEMSTFWVDCQKKMIHLMNILSTSCLLLQTQSITLSKGIGDYPPLGY